MRRPGAMGRRHLSSTHAGRFEGPIVSSCLTGNPYRTVADFGEHGARWTLRWTELRDVWGSCTVRFLARLFSRFITCQAVPDHTGHHATVAMSRTLPWDNAVPLPATGQPELKMERRSRVGASIPDGLLYHRTRAVPSYILRDPQYMYVVGTGRRTFR